MAIDRTNYIALVDDDGSNTVGTDWSKNQVKIVLLDPIDALVGEWTTYTPSWVGSVTNPVVGNGTLLGRYMKVNKIVFVDVYLLAGSTTTYGSGSYTFALPPFAAADINGQTGHAMLYHAGGLETVGSILLPTTATFTARAISLGTGPGMITPTLPFTWANNDQFRATFFYVTA